jgi:hypothetical protein
VPSRRSEPCSPPLDIGLATLLQLYSRIMDRTHARRRAPP